MDRPGGAGVSARHALVVTGGPSPAGLADLPARELVIAADRGAEHALALGLEVDLVVGDLDSIDPDTLARLEEGGTRVEHHPADKDETDLELALAAALEAGATSATIAGSASGLADAAMSPGIAVGLSNLMTGPTATVTVGTGTLLVVQPGREAA